MLDILQSILNDDRLVGERHKEYLKRRIKQLMRNRSKPQKPAPHFRAALVKRQRKERPLKD